MIVWVAIFGALGAVCRYLMSQSVNISVYGNVKNVVFPVGTLSVNVIGSLLMGFLFSFFMLKLDIDEGIKTGIMVGFLGGFTTFSSFSLEVVRLLENNQWLVALSYVLLSVVLSISMCFIGIWLGRLLA